MVGMLKHICIRKELVAMVKEKINNMMAGRLQTEPAVAQRLELGGVIRRMDFSGKQVGLRKDTKRSKVREEEEDSKNILSHLWPPSL